jgi:hypothetical protein
MFKDLFFSNLIYKFDVTQIIPLNFFLTETAKTILIFICKYRWSEIESNRNIQNMGEGGGGGKEGDMTQTLYAHINKWKKKSRSILK